jgi:hypothetical protein
LSSASDGRAAYLSLVDRVRRFARAWIPAGGRVAVVSKGDDDLLALDGIEAVHFPGAPDGGYAGFYPADGAAALVLVEELRARGIRHLLFPATAFWWLDHYAELREHLERDCERVSRDDQTAVLFAVAPEPAQTAAAPAAAGGLAAVQLAWLLDALLPPGAGVVVAGSDTAREAMAGRPTWPMPPGTGADRGADGHRLIRALAGLRIGGAGFVAVPFHPALAPPDAGRLAESLGRLHRLVTHQRSVCALFDLAGAPRSASAPRPPAPEERPGAYEADARRVVRGLLPADADVVLLASASGLDAARDAEFVVLPPGSAAPPASRPGDLIWSDRRCRIYRLASRAPARPPAGVAGADTGEASR